MHAAHVAFPFSLPRYHALLRSGCGSPGKRHGMPRCGFPASVCWRRHGSPHDGDCIRQERLQAAPGGLQQQPVRQRWRYDDVHELQEPPGRAQAGHSQGRGGPVRQGRRAEAGRRLHVGGHEGGGLLVDEMSILQEGEAAGRGPSGRPRRLRVCGAGREAGRQRDSVRAEPDHGAHQRAADLDRRGVRRRLQRRPGSLHAHGKGRAGTHAGSGRLHLEGSMMHEA